MSVPKIPKIALEEAFTLPELASKSSAFAGPNGGQDLATDLVDIQGRRLERMKASGVSLMVLSLTSPGPQDEPDQEKALALARRANDYLADEIQKNPSCFAGLASLSMHDPKTAVIEARRAVKDLGLVGIIVNDFQTVSADGEQVVFYDQPQWDVFWKEVTELDVPVYIHPRLTTPDVSRKFLAERLGLRGSAYFFSVGVSLHVLGLYVNGVFERFPKLQIIVGHMGEHLLLQLWRIDHRLSYNTGAMKPKTKKTFREVMKAVRCNTLFTVNFV
ncbi:2,3-dihydroxybenzoate decarboxylase [Ilyonectria robusta]